MSDQSSALIARYRYNGLGERIAAQDDTDGDASVEITNSNDDPWQLQLYDDRWRVVAMINAVDDGAGLEAGEYLADADDDPKELFVHHAAGLNGRGGSSYIDTTILRDADVNGLGQRVRRHARAPDVLLPELARRRREPARRDGRKA